MSSRVPPEQVRSNRGAAGIDGQTIAEVETYGVARMLDELREQVETHRYRPAPVRRVYIVADFTGNGHPVSRELATTVGLSSGDRRNT